MWDVCIICVQYGCNMCTIWIQYVYYKCKTCVHFIYQIRTKSVKYVWQGKYWISNAEILKIIDIFEEYESMKGSRSPINAQKSRKYRHWWCSTKTYEIKPIWLQGSQFALKKVAWAEFGPAQPSLFEYFYTYFAPYTISI